MKRPLGLNVAEKIQWAGTSKRGAAGLSAGAVCGSGREYGSAASKPLASSATSAASATVSAKTDTVSFNRQAGTTPRLDNRPLVGFSPTMLLKPAGTRPEPAVSVPSANGTRPRATTEAEPELEPPLT